MGSTQFFR